MTGRHEGRQVITPLNKTQDPFVLAQMTARSPLSDRKNISQEIQPCLTSVPGISCCTSVAGTSGEASRAGASGGTSVACSRMNMQ
jgi:hypothetical protein